MTKPKKKPAKGVPMPSCLMYFECGWKEYGDGISPVARLVPWSIPAIHIDSTAIEREYRKVMAWLANPQQPKGVRRG